MWPYCPIILSTDAGIKKVWIVDGLAGMRPSAAERDLIKFVCV